ncbi:MAG: hypothetical protein ACKVOH_02450 [Chlamydiales bacterium]
MRIDIVTTTRYPFSFENYAACQVQRELQQFDVRIVPLDVFVQNLAHNPPDRTLSFEPFPESLSDIYQVPHFHWECFSFERAAPLLSRLHTSVGYFEKKQEVHYITPAVERVERREEALFDVVSFTSLIEGEAPLVQSIHLFGEHQGKNLLVQYPQLSLHPPLPYVEKLHVLAQAKIAIVQDAYLLPALAAGCTPLCAKTPFAIEVLGEESPFFFSHPEEQVACFIKKREELPSIEEYSWKKICKKLIEYML